MPRSSRQSDHTKTSWPLQRGANCSGIVMSSVHQVWPKPSCKAQWKGEEDKADRERGGKTASGNALEFGKSQRAVGTRGKWRKLVAKSSVVHQRPSRLRDWWWWWRKCGKSKKSINFTSDNSEEKNCPSHFYNLNRHFKSLMTFIIKYWIKSQTVFYPWSLLFLTPFENQEYLCSVPSVNKRCFFAATLSSQKRHARITLQISYFAT